MTRLRRAGQWALDYAAVLAVYVVGAVEALVRRMRRSR